MMKKEFVDSYNGLTWLPNGPYGAPKSIMWLGDDHSDDDAICELPQAGALIRRLGLDATLNRRGSPWV